MSEFSVSSRYTKALLELAEDKGKFEQISEDMSLVYNTVKDSKELRSLFKNPVIAAGKKKDVLKEIFGKKISEESMSFVLFVVDKNREIFIPDILRRFIDLRNKKLNLVSVQVTSAIEMSGEQKNKLKTRLEEFTEKNVELSFRKDEEMIGGFTARVGDTVIDASVANQLRNMKKKFLQSSEINT